MDRRETVRPRSRRDQRRRRDRHGASRGSAAMTNAGRVVTFGEVMLRLKSPELERLFQSPILEATFGGAEANVAVSLAQFGVPVSFVSAIPSNPIGDACVGELRRYGVDTSRVRRHGDRLGIYFLEAGANQRPSRVVYDRSGSAI